MLREKLIDKSIGDDKHFRWRSREISRIEGLSDAVFAFAVTLLVVSLEVPKTFGDLMETMSGFGAFGISFTMLFVVWFNQYRFFRRYGLQNTLTICLNGILLFVVLFYVYPLKFLFSFLVGQLTGIGGHVRMSDGTLGPMVENDSQITTLMIIFGAGYIAVFSVFVFLYWQAYRQRSLLELNELEILDTRKDIQQNALNVFVGMISVAVALLGGAAYVSWSGMVYILSPVLLTVHETLMGKRRRKLEKHLGSPANILRESD